MTEAVEIVEVGPRDGYQGVKPFIPTTTKIAFLRRLAGAGLKRIEIGSFVSPNALPQLADTREVLQACAEISGFEPQVLVPNARYGRLAAEAGARFLAYVVSVSEAHNQSNVKRSPRESIDDYARLLSDLPGEAKVRLNIATAFDCPFDGRVAEAEAFALLDRAVAVRGDVELCLCDTTGRATPDQVESLFAVCQTRYPSVKSWAMHAHDTYGLGLANVYAAWRQGVRVMDASFAGLGGCPFAPGATGNVATEDVVWMFQRMGVATDVGLDALIPVALDGARIEGALPGGRARFALTARR